MVPRRQVQEIDLFRSTPFCSVLNFIFRSFKYTSSFLLV